MTIKLNILLIILLIQSNNQFIPKLKMFRVKIHNKYLHWMILLEVLKLFKTKVNKTKMWTPKQIKTNLAKIIVMIF